MLVLPLAAAAATLALVLTPALIVLLTALAPLLAAATAGAALVRAASRRHRPRESARTPPPPPPPPPLADPGTDALNAALAAVWPLILDAVEASSAAALASALPPPPLPLSLRLRLAGPPPRFDAFSVTPPDGASPLALDASLAWAGGVEVDVGLGRTRRPRRLALGASVDAATVAVRAEVVAFTPVPPGPAATLRVSLPSPPELAVSTWAGGPGMAGLLPVLDAFIEAAIRDALCGPLLAPGGVEVDMPPGSGASGGGGTRGVAVIDVIAAAGLPPGLAGPLVVLVAVPGGRAVGGGSGGGAASVVSRARPARGGGQGGTADFAASPPAAFLIPSPGPQSHPVRARLSLYATIARGGGGGGGGAPTLVGSGEVEEGEASGREGGAWVGLTKAGGAPLTPRTASAVAASPLSLRPRVRARLLVGRPGGADAATTTTSLPPPPPTPPPPGSPEDWLAGGVLRVGLARPPPPPAAAAAAGGGARRRPPAAQALARLVEARAGGRAAWLGGAGDDAGAAGDDDRRRPADLALPASALPAGSLTLTAWDWAWATAADAPLSFTRPGVGRAGPAVLSLPLARLAAARRTTGVYGLGGGGGGAGAPPGVRPAVAVDVRWTPFLERGR